MEVLKTCATLISVIMPLVACGRDPLITNFEHGYPAVHAIVDARSGIASAMVTWNSASTRIRPVTEAEIVLTKGASEQWSLQPGASNACTDSGGRPVPGCYATRLDAELDAGDEFRLSSRLPNGTSAQGRTFLPPRPDVLLPGINSNIRVNCPSTTRCNGGPGRPLVAVFPVAFTTGAGAGWIEVHLQPVSVYRGEQQVDTVSCQLNALSAPTSVQSHGTDSIRVAIREIHCADGSGTLVPWDSIDISILVTAFDANYSKYMSMVNTVGAVRDSAMGAGIQGVFGVFSAVATTDVPVTLLRK